jgi:hypothetical protein
VSYFPIDGAFFILNESFYSIVKNSQDKTKIKVVKVDFETNNYEVISDGGGDIQLNLPLDNISGKQFYPLTSCSCYGLMSKKVAIILDFSKGIKQIGVS